jgi:hypothetical protein
MNRLSGIIHHPSKLTHRDLHRRDHVLTQHSAGMYWLSLHMFHVPFLKYLRNLCKSDYLVMPGLTRHPVDNCFDWIPSLGLQHAGTRFAGMVTL